MQGSAVNNTDTGASNNREQIPRLFLLRRLCPEFRVTGNARRNVLILIAPMLVVALFPDAIVLFDCLSWKREPPENSPPETLVNQEGRSGSKSSIYRERVHWICVGPHAPEADQSRATATGPVFNHILHRRHICVSGGSGSDILLDGSSELPDIAPHSRLAYTDADCYLGGRLVADEVSPYGA